MAQKLDVFLTAAYDFDLSIKQAKQVIDAVQVFTVTAREPARIIEALRIAYADSPHLASFAFFCFGYHLAETLADQAKKRP